MYKEQAAGRGVPTPMSPPLHDLIRSKHSLAVGRRAGSGSMQLSINWHSSCGTTQRAILLTSLGLRGKFLQSLWAAKALDRGSPAVMGSSATKRLAGGQGGQAPVRNNPVDETAGSKTHC